MFALWSVWYSWFDSSPPSGGLHYIRRYFLFNFIVTGGGVSVRWAMMLVPALAFTPSLLSPSTFQTVSQPKGVS